MISLGFLFLLLPSKMELATVAYNKFQFHKALELMGSLDGKGLYGSMPKRKILELMIDNAELEEAEKIAYQLVLEKPLHVKSWQNYQKVLRKSGKFKQALNAKEKVYRLENKVLTYDHLMELADDYQYVESIDDQKRIYHELLKSGDIGEEEFLRYARILITQNDRARLNDILANHKDIYLPVNNIKLELIYNFLNNQMADKSEYVLRESYTRDKGLDPETRLNENNQELQRRVYYPELFSSLYRYYTEEKQYADAKSIMSYMVQEKLLSNKEHLDLVDDIFAVGNTVDGFRELEKFQQRKDITQKYLLEAAKRHLWFSNPDSAQYIAFKVIRHTSESNKILSTQEDDGDIKDLNESILMNIDVKKLEAFKILADSFESQSQPEKSLKIWNAFINQKKYHPLTKNRKLYLENLYEVAKRFSWQNDNQSSLRILNREFFETLTFKAKALKTLQIYYVFGADVAAPLLAKIPPSKIPQAHRDELTSLKKEIIKLQELKQREIASLRQEKIDEISESTQQWKFSPTAYLKENKNYLDLSFKSYFPTGQNSLQYFNLRGIHQINLGAINSANWSFSQNLQNSKENEYEIGSNLNIDKYSAKVNFGTRPSSSRMSIFSSINFGGNILGSEWASFDLYVAEGIFDNNVYFVENLTRSKLKIYDERKLNSKSNDFLSRSSLSYGYFHQGHSFDGVAIDIQADHKLGLFNFWENQIQVGTWTNFQFISSMKSSVNNILNYKTFGLGAFARFTYWKGKRFDWKINSELRVAPDLLKIEEKRYSSTIDLKIEKNFWRNVGFGLSYNYNLDITEINQGANQNFEISIGGSF